MANRNWMRTEPLGQLGRTKEQIERFGNYAKLHSNITKEQRNLLEEYKSRIISLDEFREGLKQLKEEKFEAVDMPQDCDDCPYLRTTPDMYGTGDSPTDYECNGSADTCHCV